MLMGRLVERASLGTSATQVFAMEDFAAVLASKAKIHAMSAMSLARVLNVRKHTSLGKTTGANRFKAASGWMLRLLKVPSIARSNRKKLSGWI